MVDFSNAKLCGASPEMNDVFAKLEAAADEIIIRLKLLPLRQQPSLKKCKMNLI